MVCRCYLVAYDIREDGRLRAVHKAMKTYGDPLQYSVFLCDLDDLERIWMKAALRAVMNKTVDSVAIVDLGQPDGRGIDCFEFLGATLRLRVVGRGSSEASSGPVVALSPRTPRPRLTCKDAP